MSNTPVSYSFGYLMVLVLWELSQKWYMNGAVLTNRGEFCKTRNSGFQRDKATCFSEE